MQIYTLVTYIKNSGGRIKLDYLSKIKYSVLPLYKSLLIMCLHGYVNEQATRTDQYKGKRQPRYPGLQYGC